MQNDYKNNHEETQQTHKEAEDDYKRDTKLKRPERVSTTQQEVVQLQSLDKNTTTEAK